MSHLSSAEGRHLSSVPTHLIHYILPFFEAVGARGLFESQRMRGICQTVGIPIVGRDDDDQSLAGNLYLSHISAPLATTSPPKLQYRVAHFTSTPHMHTPVSLSGPLGLSPKKQRRSPPRVPVPEIHGRYRFLPLGCELTDAQDRTLSAVDQHASRRFVCGVVETCESRGAQFLLPLLIVGLHTRFFDDQVVQPYDFSA
jgi:hypothetical protein